MIISPISSVTTPGLQVTAALSLDTVSALSLTSGIGADSSLLDTARNSNITVDVSRLGELLAYVAKLQNRQTEDVAITDGVNRTDTAQTETDFAQFTAIASSFVDAFNQLQASNSSLSNNPLVPTSSDSLLQAINAGAQNADGTSLFEQLGGIGINLQNASQPDSNSLLTLDVASFQNALAKDSSGTIALLTQALQVLGSAESTVITQNQEFASGNILANTGTNSIENTATTNAANNSNNINANSDPKTDTTGATATGNVNTVTPAANAGALLQQTLADEALQAEIETARNSKTAVNADVSNTVTVNTVDDAAQAIPGIPASPETRAAGLPASNDATNTAQINTPTNAGLTISTNGTNGTNGTNATNARIDTVPDAVANTGTGIDLNVASNTLAIDAGATGSTLSITADTANTANTTLPQSLNIQTPAQTSVQTPLQSPSTEIVDTPKAVQANTVTENKLATNVTTPVTTPSSLLTESRLENKIAANSIQSNENAASTTASGNTKTAPNNYSALAEVSQTLDTTLATINQTSTTASNITASNQSPPVSLASTTTANTVTSNTSTQQTTPASNSAAVNANINATDIPHIQDGINPLISAAVAAYRVRDGIQANTTEKPRPAQTDTVTATEAITVVEPVTLDLHEHSQNQRHDAEADSAYHEAEELGEPDKIAEVAGNINVNA
ncbi:hypothetical protein [Undibacterium sp. Ji49W]|uniref:hypothetical protein n=1 Tax=Undibacterium sp. Ji49W TaxID=3413040 RepID=UPI003BF25C98